MLNNPIDVHIELHDNWDVMEFNYLRFLTDLKCDHFVRNLTGYLLFSINFDKLVYHNCTISEKRMIR